MDVLAADITEADGQQRLDRPVERHRIPQELVIDRVVLGVITLLILKSALPVALLDDYPAVVREVGNLCEEEPEARD